VVMQDIFLADGLHMNKKGYDIWAKTIGPLLKR
jgi:lysophospholipase L1-like esterase